jgi:hypothetical protein
VKNFNESILKINDFPIDEEELTLEILELKNEAMATFKIAKKLAFNSDLDKKVSDKRQNFEIHTFPTSLDTLL